MNNNRCSNCGKKISSKNNLCKECEYIDDKELTLGQILSIVFSFISFFLLLIDIILIASHNSTSLFGDLGAIGYYILLQPLIIIFIISLFVLFITFNTPNNNKCLSTSKKNIGENKIRKESVRKRK